MSEYIFVLVGVAIFSGVVRGYSGFGFAAIAVVGFNFFLSPQQSIPIVLALDVLCSFGVCKQALEQADMPILKTLTFGSVLGIPVGLSLLFFIPETSIKLLISLFILILSVMVLCDFRLKKAEKFSTQLSFGVASGIGTAGASVGGPLIVCYMLSSQLTTAAQRGTMILFFIISELIALVAMISSGMVETQTLELFGLLFLPTLIAVRAGQWFFNHSPPKSLKHFALPVMLLVSVLGVSDSLSHLF